MRDFFLERQGNPGSVVPVTEFLSWMEALPLKNGLFVGWEVVERASSELVPSTATTVTILGVGHTSSAALGSK
jgi:hypothetical protein